jgi:hypothetical protein
MGARHVFTVASGAALACGLFPDVGTLEADGSAGDVTNGKDVVVIPSDGGGDGGDAGFGLSPCTTTHTFCDDFDQGSLGAIWDQVATQSGPLVFSTTNFVTPPHALQAPATSAGSPSSLAKMIASANHVHVAFDAMVQAPSNTSQTEVDFATIELQKPPTGFGFCNIGVARVGGGTVVQQYASPLDAGSASVLDRNSTETFATWRHVEMDLVFSTQTFNLRIDGTVVATFTLNPAVPQTSTFISVGASYVANTHADWAVFIDNVVVDTN